MVYVVKSGDTLFAIAQKYTGDGNRYRELLPLNPQIPNPNYIEIGDMVNLPDSWGASSSSTSPGVSPSTSDDAEEPSVNNAVVIGAVVILAAAGAYWYMGKSQAAANPVEDEEDEADEEDEEDEGEE